MSVHLTHLLIPVCTTAAVEYRRDLLNQVTSLRPAAPRDVAGAVAAGNPSRRLPELRGVRGPVQRCLQL